MITFPSEWALRRKGLFPILEIMGTCNESLAEPFLIKSAVRIIERAKLFEGHPCNTPPTERRVKVGVQVTITLIFPTIEALENYEVNIMREFPA